MHDAYSIVVLCVNDPHAGMKSIIEKASPSFKKGQTYWKENSLWSSFLFFRSFKAEMKMFLKRNNPFKVIAPSNQKKNFHSRIWPFILFFCLSSLFNFVLHEGFHEGLWMKINVAKNLNFQCTYRIWKLGKSWQFPRDLEETFLKCISSLASILWCLLKVQIVVLRGTYVELLRSKYRFSAYTCTLLRREKVAFSGLGISLGPN